MVGHISNTYFVLLSCLSLRMSPILPWLLLSCLGCGFAQAANLPQTVRDELKRINIPLSTVSVVVQELDNPKPLLAHNAEGVMNPASTMKLLTTFAGLELLGPAYRWKTEVYLNGKLENGVLQGDLVFKGYGDPKLTVEQFWLWMRELRQRGLREIRGDVVLDRSFFAIQPHDPAAFDNAPTRAYNVGPDALLLNFNALHLRFTSGGALLNPDLAGYKLLNQTRSAALSCSADDAYTARLEGRSIVLYGTVANNCGEIEDYFALLPPNDYFAAVFAAIWQELGGQWSGKLKEGVATGAVFSTHWSPALAEVIRDINKFSNNTLARQLFLTLGANEQVPGSINNSKAQIAGWLAKRKLDFPELVLENGAGLSRHERISAEHLVVLLQQAARSQFYPEFAASLPILGLDGTVRRRFKNSELSGAAHLKTGTLEGVKSIAGYVQDRNGKQWAMVFVVNHANAKQAQAAQDALIEWVWQR